MWSVHIAHGFTSTSAHGAYDVCRVQRVDALCSRTNGGDRSPVLPELSPSQVLFAWHSSSNSGPRACHAVAAG